MIKTRLTDRYGLKYPVIQAPMALAAGGKLAASVARAGGMGIIGGGYGDSDWLDEQFEAAGNQQIGCGFITWSLALQPHLLDMVLERKPQSIFLSFGDPEPFVDKIKNAGVALICQVQTRKDGKRAIEVGADIIVAQGAEAGGHGELRGTFTIVPELVDLVSSRSAEIMVVAAGGVGDGRGLSAALMLGADGVLVGSRFWASEEALVHPNMLQAAIDATGDETIRSSVMDIARNLDWPDRYTARVLKNDFTDKWHTRTDDLIAAAEIESKRWREAWVQGDTSIANTFVGEVTGLIQSIEPSAKILEEMVFQAEELLRNKFR